MIDYAARRPTGSLCVPLFAPASRETADGSFFETRLDDVLYNISLTNYISPLKPAYEIARVFFTSDRYFISLCLLPPLTPLIINLEIYRDFLANF